MMIHPSDDPDHNLGEIPMRRGHSEGFHHSKSSHIRGTGLSAHDHS